MGILMALAPRITKQPVQFLTLAGLNFDSFSDFLLLLTSSI